MYRTKREIALEQDSQAAKLWLEQVGCDIRFLQTYIKDEAVQDYLLSTRKKLDHALATLDFNPSKRGLYTYQD